MIKVYFSNISGEKIDKSIMYAMKRAVAHTVKTHYPDHNFEVSLTMCGDDHIKKLNTEYRNNPKSTDVLSFPMFDFDTPQIMTLLGDIVISVPTAKRQAAEYGHSEMREFVFLCVHSALHLLGYDHETTEEDRLKMEAKQSEIMKTLGIFKKGDIQMKAKKDYKRILTIQDVSCVGQCSLTVALPIISACGIETAILPSAVLSTHTGGFTGYTFRDLTDDIPLIRDHWLKENIKFDAFYTGYLGSPKQIDYVTDIMRSLGKDGSVNVIDPAMADNGKLYAGFGADHVEAMKKLCCEADFLLPNITEACLLTDTEYKTEYDEDYVKMLCNKLHDSGSDTVILTGVSYDNDTTGVVVSDKDSFNYYRHKKIAEGCHGTGDVYASAFVGALLNGKSTFDSARIAADYTVLCIENTIDDASHKYGVKFEPQLPELFRMINEE